MTEGHCLICPLQHHCSATGMDEDIWAEMQVSPSVLRILLLQATGTTFICIYRTVAEIIGAKLLL